MDRDAGGVAPRHGGASGRRIGPPGRGTARACLPVAAALLLAALPGALAGRPSAPAIQATDTVPGREEVLDEAKDRQRAFERYRRLRLPYAGGGSGGSCDEFVGRYCLWHEDGDEEYEPPEEPESVVRDRDRLLDHLAGALARLPDSDWLVGQRVRYLLEADRPDAAYRQATSDCRAAPWWCRALSGLVLHERGDVVAAGRAFDAALATMGADRRRRWTDVSELLEGDARDRWEEADDAGREAMARRLWYLADPLHLVPGNDRRTEHLARRVEIHMREDAATPFASHWDDGLAELTLRYGVPYAFGREPRRAGQLGNEVSVIGRHHPDALVWLPSSDALLDPAGAGDDDWELDDPEPRSEHAPSHADTTGRLDHWLTVFPRGDTSVVVAAYRPTLPDTPMDEPDADDGQARDTAAAPDAAHADRPGVPPEEALLRLVPVAAIDTTPADRPATEDRWTGGARRGLAVRVPSRPHLLSLELLRRTSRTAERSRYGLPLAQRPEGLPGLSDLLVLEAGDSLPPTLEAALPRARGPAPVRPGDRLGLYWEIYGPRRLMRDVEVSLTLAEGDGGVIDRLAGALGLRDGDVVSLGWKDRVGDTGRVHPRGVQLRLPEDLSDGEYRLELSVRVPGYETMTAGRDLTVTGEEGRGA